MNFFLNYLQLADYIAYILFIYIMRVQSWKPPTISVHLDFLKCVHIFVLFPTQIFTESVSRFFRH